MESSSALKEIEKSAQLLCLGAEAIKGIGALLNPETADEQLNFAHRSEAAAIFLFLGEVLKPAADAICNAADGLEMEIRKQ
jgi:hypothetical protein